MNRISLNAYPASFINNAALALSTRQKKIVAVAAAALTLLAAVWFIAM